MEDNGSAYGQLVLLLAAAGLLVLFLEMLGCLLKRWALARNMPTADQGTIDDVKSSYATYIRRRHKRSAATKAKKSPRKRSTMSSYFGRVASSGSSLGSGNSGTELQEAGAASNSSVLCNPLSVPPTPQAYGTVDTPRVELPIEMQHRVRHVNEILEGATDDQLSYFNELSPEQAASMPRDEGMRWIMAALASEKHEEEPERTTSKLGKLLPTKEVRGQCFINISLRGLDFYIGNARVLKSLYCDCFQGQLVALMGESGSGKSTLLNVLGGRSNYGDIRVTQSRYSAAEESDGTCAMFLNEAPYHPRRHKAIIGFVPQAHIIFKELTVFENLWYASEMRADRSMNGHTRMRLVEMALDLLGLRECRHFVCDPSLGERLSGGQMRRIGSA